MSIHQPERTTPTVPDTMRYTDEERKLARQKQRETLPWYKKKAVKVGGVVLALGGIGGGIAAMSSGGDKAPAPTPDTTTNAPATPGEKEAPTKVLAPAEAIGTEQTDYDVLNVQPSAADVEKALEPLSAKEYTPEEAVAEFGKKINVYTLGGKIDNNDGELPETQASSEEGNMLLASMFDESLLNGTELDDFRRTRTMVANRFNLYGTDKRGNIETGKYEIATMNLAWENLEKDSTDSSGMTFDINTSVNTNFEAVDREESFDNPGVDESHTLKNTVVLEVIDGDYKIKSLSTSS